MYRGHFIPVCWGGVLDGKAGCYCHGGKPVHLAERLQKLEEKITDLTNTIEQMEKEKDGRQ